MKIVLASIFLLVLNINAQNRYLSSYPRFGIEIKDKTVYYNKYPNDFFIYGDYNSFKEFQSLYPEQTLKSILSAKNYEWDKNNYDYLIKNNDQKYSTSNEKAFFHLLLKVTFEFNGLRYSIIKYHIHEKDNIVPNCSILVRKDKRWYVIKPEGSLSKAFFMFNYLSLKSLDAIFNNNLSSIKK